MKLRDVINEQGMIIDLLKTENAAFVEKMRAIAFLVDCSRDDLAEDLLSAFVGDDIEVSEGDLRKAAHVISEVRRLSTPSA